MSEAVADCRAAGSVSPDFAEAEGLMEGFTVWLARHVMDQDVVGEVARGAAADPNWPEGPNRLETFTDHLESRGASETELQSLMDAWIRYASH
ncbi:YozE family protein [Streptomyces aureoversilis]|uniref:YozE family protein n=1 Tax=Streptomyces aureoversilis TaxID=67277 RepID=A0ABV9ZRS4_9ACTN